MLSFRVELAQCNRKLGKMISGTRLGLQKPHTYIIPQKGSFLRIFHKRHFESFLQETLWFIRIRAFRNKRRRIPVSSHAKNAFLIVSEPECAALLSPESEAPTFSRHVVQFAVSNGELHGASDVGYKLPITGRDRPSSVFLGRFVL